MPWRRRVQRDIILLALSAIHLDAFSAFSACSLLYRLFSSHVVVQTRLSSYKVAVRFPLSVAPNGAQVVMKCQQPGSMLTEKACNCERLG